MNFDMSPHLANKDGIPTNPMLLGGVGWSPWKRPRKISTPNDNTYDLYAVCYHHGNDLETGHYTAACKNPYDQQWYRFDDTRVTHIPNEDITMELINNSAYILFYQRRQGNFVGCSSNSSAASTSSIGSNNDHWAARMPKFSYQPKKDNTLEMKNASAAKPVESVKPILSEKNITDIMNNESEPTFKNVHLRASTTSLQDSHLEKEKLTLSPSDDKNLRNSISLSDNLKISTSNMGTINTSEVKLDLISSDNLINKDSMFTMGESRRNTLSEYRNSNDEFSSSQMSNEAVHRNSISLTVEPYLQHKDIHVNPKMTIVSKTESNGSDNEKNPPYKCNGDTSISSYNFNKYMTSELDRSQKVTSVRTSLYENSVLEPSPVINWLRGEKGYSTLRPRNCSEDVSLQKDHHSDDEALPARNDWVN